MLRRVGRLLRGLTCLLGIAVVLYLPVSYLVRVAESLQVGSVEVALVIDDGAVALYLIHESQARPHRFTWHGPAHPNSALVPGRYHVRFTCCAFTWVHI